MANEYFNIERDTKGVGGFKIKEHNGMHEKSLYCKTVDEVKHRIEQWMIDVLLIQSGD